MDFSEALRLAAHRLGLAGRPDARLAPVAFPVTLGAVLMALSGFGAAFYLAGAGIWLCCAVFALAGPVRTRGRA